MLDPVVQAATLQGVVHVASPVGSEHDDGGRLGSHGPELGNGDGVLGEDLEEEGLELVVGAIDLVDEEHGHRPDPRLKGPQEGPTDEEALVVDLVLGFASGLAGGLDSPQVEQLARVVPLVCRLAEVDALVALQAEQLAPVQAESTLATSVLPTPASPSRKSGRLRASARNTAVARPSSAR